ncbi:AraC family transcriptional regulator [Bacteroides uniformis]|jgi:hypothetical protein|uniref:AraC family transcriptional regulator n=1 Tax=Bacteroides uniformis TaxID=820 RepID=A0A3E5F0X1_BACUN|nr:helix-turn-helix transcriptional regulator [Bacteroides uniformis]RGN94366.1 AraC family transcriptional regulator [Bacteroides uniformis]
MADIKIVNHIQEYDNMIGAETLHPLVNVVDFSKLPPIRNFKMHRLFGYYAIYLKGAQSAKIHYGRSIYQYKEGALVFFAPGQVAGAEDDGKYHKITGYVLMFHPDLLKGTALSQLMKQYSYFSYDINEALLPTEDEKAILIDCFERIEKELRYKDRCSISIVIDYIKLILDYCVRFYDRQFSSQQVQNKDILVRFEHFLNNYFSSGYVAEKGLPTVQGCADELCLSTNYFNDLVRKATGTSALKLIHRKMLEIAQEQLLGTNKRVNEIANELGFQQSQNFTNWFKKQVGCTPLNYRNTYCKL